MSKKTNKKSSFISGLVIGGAVGSVLGILFAPQQGTVTRKDIRNRVRSVFVRQPKQAQSNLVVQAFAQEAMQVRNNVNRAPKKLLNKLVNWLEK